MGCRERTHQGNLNSSAYLPALITDVFLFSHMQFLLNTTTCPEKMPQMPMMTRMLNTADPTMVPTPTSPFVINTPKAHKRTSHKSRATNNLICKCGDRNDGLYRSHIHIKGTKLETLSSLLFYLRLLTEYLVI